MKQKLLITLMFLMTWGTGSVWADEPTTEQYNAAMTNITAGYYRIYASNDKGSTKYYLKVSISNINKNEADFVVATTANAVGQASIFTIVQSEEGNSKLVTTGWHIFNNTYSFTNPTGGNENDASFTAGTCLRGYLYANRNNTEKQFDRQVLYCKDGAYAIRSTNSSGTTWGAGAYWGLNGSNNACYVQDPSYIWYLERVYFAAPNGNYAICFDNTYYVTQKNENTDNGGGSYYADLLNKELRNPDSYCPKTGEDVLNFNWTFTFTPVDGNDASKGVTVTTTNGYLDARGYVVKTNNTSEAPTIYLIATSEGGPYSITANMTTYWSGGKYGWSSPVNIINTSTEPVYNFTFPDIKLKYYDQTADYIPTAISQRTNAVIYRGGMSTERWYSMVLPFAVSSVTEMFGTGATAATLTSYDSNTFNFTSQTLIPANTPFLVKPGYGTIDMPASQKKNHTCYAITILTETVSDGNPQTSVTGATFTGVYSSGNVPVGSYFISSNTLYEAEDNFNIIGAFRAYLSLEGGSSVKAFAFSVDGETTGIMTIGEKGEVEMSTEVYDLNGRRVSKPTRGLYIVNGKIVVLK